MTVENTTDRIYYDGNAVTFVFATGFQFFDHASVKVYVDGVLQVEGTDYTLAGGDGAAGSVTFVTPPSSGTRNVFVQRMEPYTQSSDFTPGGPMPADVADTVHDKLTLQTQQLAAALAAKIGAPDGHTASAWTGNLPDPGDSANWGKALTIAGDGNGIDLHTISGTGDLTILTTKGDLAYHTGGGVARLPIGTAYQRLMVDATTGLPTWFTNDAISVVDLGLDNTGSDDNTAALAAILAAGTYPYLIWPAGTYLVDGGFTPPDGAVWISEQGAILQVNAATTQNNLLTIAATRSFRCRGLVFDGNNGVVAQGQNLIVINGRRTHFEYCRFLNAKAASGYGIGVLYVDTSLSEALSHHTNIGCEASGNDSHGFAAENVRSLSLTHFKAHENGGDGVYLNNYDLSFLQKIYRVTVANGEAYANTGSGIVAANFIENNDVSSPVYGASTYESAQVIIQGNRTELNDNYGIAAQGQELIVANNTAHDNSKDSLTAGGILFNAWNSLCIGNSAVLNDGYGIDAGGCDQSLVLGNSILANDGVGLNIGGSINAAARSNLIRGNGGTSGVQVAIQNVEADGSGIALPHLATGIDISGNTIILANSQVGVKIYDGAQGCSVSDNYFQGSLPQNFIHALTDNVAIKGNHYSNVARVLSTTGGGLLILPDVYDHEFTPVDTATTVSALDFYPALSLVGVGGIGWVVVTDGGSGYTSAPTVVFTGGAGSGAAATAIIDKNGVVIGVRMTNFGSGYTSAPTMSFTGGGGSGAAATSVLSVPLAPWREVEVFATHASGMTISRAGTPVVEVPDGSSDTVLTVRDTARFRSMGNQWYRTSLHN